MPVSVADIATSFVLGLLATGAPCVLPLYPGFLAYLSSSPGSFGKQVKVHWLGLLVFLGILTVMIAMGISIAALSIAVGKVLSIVVPLADFVIIALGLLMLAGKNPFMYFPQITKKFGGNPYSNAFVYGLLYGPVAFPCSGPFLVAILAISLSAAEFAESFLLFLAFGVGFGIPLFAMSFLARARQQAFVAWFSRNHRRVELGAGLLLILVGLYDLSVNLPFLLAFLGK
jgi:cytochrome c-type biogenesis protein